jgi:hypothetical protein
LNWLTQTMLEGEAAAQAPNAGPFQLDDEPHPARSSGLAGAEILEASELEPADEPPDPVECGPGPADALDAVARSGGGTVVLGCDPEVRERLRFLVWMRRVRAERRATALETGAVR